MAREGAGSSRAASREARRRGGAPPRRRALVLAAGYGTRLRPLTEELPKPLLPVLGRTLLARTLDALAGVGCEAVAINLHHRPDAIPAALGERWGAMPLVYSREDPILGTLGAFAPLRSFFAGCDEVLLVNGDSLCDWPLAALLARHRRSGAEATLLLAGRPDPRPFGGGIAVDRRGRVTAIRTDRAFGEVHRRYVYAGAYVLRPALLTRIPERAPTDSMSDLFLPLLAAGGLPVASFVTWRPWFDLGTPERYLEGVQEWSQRGGHGATGWVASAARVDPRARLERAVVEAGARVDAGATVISAVLLADAVVGPGAMVEDSVVGPGARIPPRGHIARVMATRRRGADGADGRRGESLCLTPLGE